MGISVIRFWIFGLLGGALELHLLTLGLLESAKKLPRTFCPSILKLLGKTPEKPRREFL